MIQYKRGGWWNILAPFAVLVFILDVLANYTEITLFAAELPKAGEYSISKRLFRLQSQVGVIGDISRWVVGVLNAATPGGVHIPPPSA